MKRGKITPANYLTLRNTCRILREAKKQFLLNSDDLELLAEIEAAISDYEEFLRRKKA